MSFWGNGALTKITAPASFSGLVEPKAIVLSAPCVAASIQLRCARLNGISSRSSAKKYCRKNSPALVKTFRNRPMTG